jgi:hypothetical protein
MLLTIIAILWLVVWLLLVVDVLRRKMRTLSKVLWIVGMLVFPIAGALAYMLVRPWQPTGIDDSRAAQLDTYETLREQRPM